MAYLLIGRGLPAAPGITLAWPTTRAQLAHDIRELTALGYQNVTAIRQEG